MRPSLTILLGFLAVPRGDFERVTLLIFLSLFMIVDVGKPGEDDFRKWSPKRLSELSGDYQLKGDFGDSSSLHIRDYVDESINEHLFFICLIEIEELAATPKATVWKRVRLTEGKLHVDGEAIVLVPVVLDPDTKAMVFGERAFIRLRSDHIE
jgi:hypothetical protein